MATISGFAPPFHLHIMWQTRGGRALEGALRDQFEDYRQHGDWYDFGDEHPVALTATAAVELGYRALLPHRREPSAPAQETPPQQARPSSPAAIKARNLAARINEAFDGAGNPPHLTVAEIVDFLRTKDPDTWGRWDKRRDRLTMAGRSIAETFRTAHFNINSFRLNTPGRPTAYLREDFLLPIR